MKRALEITTNAETYLSAELDAISTVQFNEIEQLKYKHNLELDDLKGKYSSLIDSCAAVEVENSSLKTELKKLEHTVRQCGNSKQSVKNDEPNTREYLEKIDQLDLENNQLLEKLHQVQDKLTNALKQNIQNEV